MFFLKGLNKFGGAGAEEDLGTQEMKDFKLLLGRLESSSLQEEKRSALIEIDELLSYIQTETKTPFQADSNMLRVLLQQLQKSENDHEILIGVVQILLKFLTPTEQHNSAQSTEKIVSLWVQEPDRVTTLLDLLQIPHANIRYYSMKILLILLEHRHEKVQAVVLSHPMVPNITLTTKQPKQP